MYRWFPLLAALAAVVALSCGGGDSDDATAIADRVLRIGEGVGTEVEIFDGSVPDNLDDMLNPGNSDEDPVTLPPLPNSKLIGSAQVTRTDGLHTFFLMYEVKQDEATASDAARGLFDETPWQVVGGQSSEGVTAYRFQNTRSGDLVGTVVVQPLPTTEKFEVVVSRGGKEQKLTLQRHAFTPVLGAELDEREGGVVVSKLGAGEGANAGLKEGDRVVQIGGEDTKDLTAVSAALRALGKGEDPVTSVIYIVQISPADPIVSPFVLPDARPVPRTFPVPFLLLDGSIPITVEWTVEPTGSAYQIALLSQDSLVDVVDAYRSMLKGQDLNVTSDEAQGTSTTLEFSSTDNQLIGSVAIDTFAEDDSYTEARLQVQAAPGFTAGRPARPAPSATAPAATSTATPGAAASPTATGTP